MVTRKATALGMCLFVAACNASETPADATVGQEVVVGAPMTVDARLIEQAGGRWRLQCLGRFRQLGTLDSGTYNAFVTFFEEGAQTALVRGQVSSANPTTTVTSVGDVLTMTHPSVDPAGSLTVRMARQGVDPRRRHSCQVVIKQNNTEVMRAESRPPRPVSKPSGTFADSGQALGTHGTSSLTLGDVDGDGDLDAVEGKTTTTPNRVLLNNGSGVFADTGQLLGNHNSRQVVLGDVDGDGDLDLFEGTAFGLYFPEGNRVWRNNGAGVFVDSGQQLAMTARVALGDIDGDRDLDAFGGSTIWFNDGAGTFVDGGQTLGSYSAACLALGDLDGDGDLDGFECVDYGSQRVWRNDSGTFTDTGQALAPHATRAVALGDLDGDGDLDLFEGNHGASRVLLNDGSGNLTDTGQALGTSPTRAVALGDVDGDGDLDAFEGNLQFGNRVWFNDGAGNFPTSSAALGAHATQALALGDLDGDGDLDAYKGNSYQASRVWLNQNQ